MTKWRNNKLVADEPKPREKSIPELLSEISAKLDTLIELNTPSDSAEEDVEEVTGE